MAVKKDGMHNKELGKKGEARARRYLFFHGYRIVAKNYVTPFGEIDIIAAKRGLLVFIEVKTRLSDIFGLPAEAVNERRKRKYIAGANYFLVNKNIDVAVRFDIIEVFRGQLNHIKNAF